MQRLKDPIIGRNTGLNIDNLAILNYNPNISGKKIVPKRGVFFKIYGKFNLRLRGVNNEKNGIT